MDEKIPPGGGRPPLSYRAAKLGPLFLGDVLRIDLEYANSQENSLLIDIGTAATWLVPRTRAHDSVPKRLIAIAQLHVRRRLKRPFSDGASGFHSRRVTV